MNATREQLGLDRLPPATGITGPVGPNGRNPLAAAAGVDPRTATRQRPRGRADRQRAKRRVDLDAPLATRGSDTPLIVISLSSSYMHQEGLLGTPGSRCFRASPRTPSSPSLERSPVIPFGTSQRYRGGRLVELRRSCRSTRRPAWSRTAAKPPCRLVCATGSPLICPLGRDQSRVGGHVVEGRTP